MEWRDEGLVIGVRRHGESSAIVEVMTRAHGRHLGIVKGGRSRRMQPVLQPGNSVELVWRARLEEHLGLVTLEPTRQRAAHLLASAFALHGINHVAFLLRLLPERDPHPALHEVAELIADHLDNPDIAPALMVRFELELLSELGFRLDLESCAATGETEDLCYVSPKSGRAVSRAAGAPWAQRMLALPGFLGLERATSPATRPDVEAGFKLTGFFLERDIFGPRGIPEPESRRAFLAAWMARPDADD